MGSGKFAYLRLLFFVYLDDDHTMTKAYGWGIINELD